MGSSVQNWSEWPASCKVRRCQTRRRYRPDVFRARMKGSRSNIAAGSSLKVDATMGRSGIGKTEHTDVPV
jgi:hypothetical protein